MSDTTVPASDAVNTTLAELLPPFLRRRNGRLELVLHCTWIQDYFVCPRKFWLRYFQCVEGTGPRAALVYGGGIHHALCTRYTNLHLSRATIEELQIQALNQWFDQHPQPSDEWRNAGRARDLIVAYNEEYPAHDWKVLAVEEEFEVLVGEVMGFAEVIPCYLAGRKDLVVAWHDGLWVVDHKTCQQWGESNVDEGRRSFQFRGYPWAERCLQALHRASKPESAWTLRERLPVLGTVGNYFVSRPPTTKPTKLPRSEFHQECYPFESSVLDEWREQFLEVAAAVLHDWQRGKWRSQDTGCGHWGRCEFYDYCEEAPERREAMLASSLFQAKSFDREL